MSTTPKRKSKPKKLSVRAEVERLLNKNVEDHEKNIPMIHHGGVYTGGMPSKMTPSCIEEIIDRVSFGELIKNIAKDPHMPAEGTIWKWIRDNQAFAEKYYKAKEFATNILGEDILSIADDGSRDVSVKFNKNGEAYTEVNQEIVKRSEIMIKARQWLMERLNSNKWNERVMSEQAGAAAKSAPSNLNATIKIMLPDNGRPITATLETTAEEV